MNDTPQGKDLKDVNLLSEIQYEYYPKYMSPYENTLPIVIGYNAKSVFGIVWKN